MGRQLHERLLRRRGRPRGRWRGGRMFEQGDLRYVVLRLLEEEAPARLRDHQGPRGEVRRRLRPQPGGGLSHPQLLEDLGYTRIVPGDEARRSTRSPTPVVPTWPRIQSTVDNIFDRISKLVGHFLDEPMLRRHRHQPALRDPGVLQAGARRRAHAGNVFGVPLADLLVADPRRRVKYLVFILRADNRGEGGILALLALVCSAKQPRRGRRARILIVLGLFGAALLYGDGIITPAISVLGAVEGLEVATPALERFVVPITVVILSRSSRPAPARRGSAASSARSCSSGSSPSRCSACRSRSCAPGVLARSTRHAVASSSTHGGTASSCSARSSSWSPAARRSTPTWGTSAAPDPPRLVRGRPAGAAAQLLRAGRAAAARPRRREPVLPARAALAALPAGRHRDAGGDRRLAGADLGRVLAHAAGGPARLLAARADRAHLGRAGGPDLHPRGQLGADGRALRSCSASGSTSALAPPTASPSPARWRSRRSCSRRRAHALGLARRRSARLLGGSSSRSTSRSSAPTLKIRTAAGSRSRSRAVFTLMTTWKRGRASRRILRRAAADRPVPAGRRAAKPAVACRARRSS